MDFKRAVVGLWVGVIGVAGVSGVQGDETSSHTWRLIVLPFEASQPTQVMVSKERMTKLLFTGVEVPTSMRLDFATPEEENIGEIVLSGSYRELLDSERISLLQVEYTVQIPARYGPSGRDTLLLYSLEPQDLRGVRASFTTALEELADRLAEWRGHSIYNAPAVESSNFSGPTGLATLEVVGPWCFVYLDRRLIGTISSPRLMVEPGKQTIGLFSPHFGYREVVIEVKPEERVVLRFWEARGGH